MKYEFGNAVWMEETSEGEVKHENIEELHQETERKIRESIEKLIESQANFLGRGMTAEVHFLEKDTKLCYKIIRKVEVLARPDAVDNLPPHYRELYEKKQKAKAEASKKKLSSQSEEAAGIWHVSLFDEATYLSRARKLMEGTRVKVPRPDATMVIKGREEGEGYEVVDDMEVLLMETMDATSVDDLMLKGMNPPEGFDYSRFCRDTEEFMAAMHADKLFHRDLHAGNIMIDNETGNPVIIDFGRSTLSTEEEAYVDEIRPGFKMHFIHDEQMFRDKVKIPLSQYLSFRNLTK